MIILDLPPHTIQVIEQIAQKQGQSIQDFITISAYEKALQSFVEPKPIEDKPLLDFIHGKTLGSFKGDPVVIQRKLRDEWD